jgi:hypothetical protein
MIVALECAFAHIRGRYRLILIDFYDPEYDGKRPSGMALAQIAREPFPIRRTP